MSLYSYNISDTPSFFIKLSFTFQFFLEPVSGERPARALRTEYLAGSAPHAPYEQSTLRGAPRTRLTGDEAGKRPARALRTEYLAGKRERHAQQVTKQGTEPTVPYLPLLTNRVPPSTYEQSTSLAGKRPARALILGAHR